MKIAITGHTKGIGQKLYDQYTRESHTVIGFSRSNGYDLSQQADIDKIVNETLDCDMFINNAYYPDNQNLLASRWFEKNQDSKKLLVNISSISPIADNYILDANKQEKYSVDKAQLDKITWDINFANKLAKSMAVSLGVVDTESANPNYIQTFKNNNTIITVNDAASIVTTTVNIFFNNDAWFIPQILILNKDTF